MYRKIELFIYLCIIGNTPTNKTVMTQTQEIRTRTDQTFKVEKSKTVTYVTRGTLILLAAVFIPTWYVAVNDPVTEGIVILTATTAIVAACMIYFYLISPKSVELTAEAIILHRVMGHKTFGYAEIHDAGLWNGSPSELLRLCGSGAYCGYIGWFSGGCLGRHFEYVGNYSNCFYIRLNGGRTYLISCDAPDIVVKKINGTKR